MSDLHEAQRNNAIGRLEAGESQTAFGIGIISKALHVVAHDRANPGHVHSTTSFTGEVYSSIL